MGFSRPEHWWHSGGRGRLTCSWIVPVLLAIGPLLINPWPAMALTLSSSAFEPGGAISWKYTCEGDNVLPPLALPARRRGLRPLRSSSTILMPPTRRPPNASGCIGSSTIFHRTPEPGRECKRRGPAWRRDGRAERLQTDRLPRALSADRTAPLFSQALRARHRASRKAAHQARTRSRDERSCAGAGRTHRHLSKGRPVNRRLATLRALTDIGRLALSGAHG